MTGLAIRADMPSHHIFPIGSGLWWHILRTTTNLGTNLGRCTVECVDFYGTLVLVPVRPRAVIHCRQPDGLRHLLVHLCMFIFP